MKPLFPALALLLGSVPGLASEPELADYLEVALEMNPALAQMEHRYEAATARIPQATALPDPMLEVSILAASDVMDPGASEVMLTQSFPWFGTLGKAGQAASAEAQAVLHTFRAAQLDLSEQVAAGYYQLAYLGRAMEVAEANLLLLQRLERVAAEATAAGAELNDLLRLQVEVGTVEDRLRGLQEAMTAQEARLLNLLGSNSLPGNATAPRLQAVSPGGVRDLEELSMQMLEDHPRILAARQQLESAEAMVAVARLKGRPMLLAGLTYMPDRTSGGMAGSDDWGIKLGISIPIWRGKYRAAEREAHAGRQSAEEALVDTENSLKADLTITLSDVRDAARRLDLYNERLLPVAQQSLQNTEESYRAGRASVLDLIDSERTLLALQLESWRASADYQQARFRLSLLTGVPIAQL